MLPKKIAVLGATGSIGRSTLDVVRQNPQRFQVVSLTAGANVELLRLQIEEFEPELVAVKEAAAAAALEKSLRGQSARPRVLCADEGFVAAATLPEVDFVVAAIVGASGLKPTLAAIEAGKDVGLANKETLVMAGGVIAKARQRLAKAGQLLPIDSEHSAIFQALRGENPAAVSKLLLTASGGPFLNWSAARLQNVTKEEALNHPTWRMGPKITIDSATLMNKGLEVIEAHWLFEMGYDKIEVIIHPQSVVHSLVEFNDGSVLAQLGVADMRVPIAYALNYPERLANCYPRLDLTEVGQLTFSKPDLERFPCLRLAYEALREGGTLPAVLNAANERAVAKFLAGEIGFNAIPRLIERVLSAHIVILEPDLSDIWQADSWAKTEVERISV